MSAQSADTIQREQNNNRALPQRAQRRRLPNNPDNLVEVGTKDSVNYHGFYSRNKVQEFGSSITLLNLPFEIFLTIVEWSLSEPWPSCDVGTYGNALNANNHQRTQHDIPSISKSASAHVDVMPKKSIFPAKTLLRVSLACKDFHQIIMCNETVDKVVWKKAARSYFDLPAELREIQGTKHSTSWRNVFRAFYNFERPVDSFGHNRQCKPALTWAEFCIHKGCFDTTNDRLSLLCIQPGPDVFDQVYDQSSRTHLLKLGLLGGNVMLSIDEFGNMFASPGLPEYLAKSPRGQFPADVFETSYDRFTIAKVALSGPDPTNSENTLLTTHTWDLKHVPGITDDPVARVARCCSYDGALLFTLFRSNNQDPTTDLLDPIECNTVHYLVSDPTRCNSPTDRQNSNQFWSTLLKYRSFEDSSHTSAEVDTGEGPYLEERTSSKDMDYFVCNMQLSKSFAVILVRWQPTQGEKQHVFDAYHRQFHILSTSSGAVLQILQLPDLIWDFRHNDMCQKYSDVRLSKLGKLYNTRDAECRSTRVHNDQFMFSEISDPSDSSLCGRIMSGSHDYCLWLWDVDFQDKNEPDHVLDDYYWDIEDQQHLLEESFADHKSPWSIKKERAGWWVDTPNQVLDFWHNLMRNPDSKRLAACRAGKLYIWNLDHIRTTGSFTTNDSMNVEAYTCLSKPDDECDGSQGAFVPEIQDVLTNIDSILSCSDDGDSSSLSSIASTTLSSPTVSGRMQPQPSIPVVPTKSRKIRTDGYLGQSLNSALSHQFRNWFEWKSRIPEQGLWMVFESGLVVYLNREDILEVSGLSDRQWKYNEDDFEPVSPNAVSQEQDT